MDKTGGPAFPVPDTYSPNRQVKTGAAGMTLQDWFAGDALVSMQVRPDDITTPEDADIYANKAYMLADAMLRARAK